MAGENTNNTENVTQGAPHTGATPGLPVAEPEKLQTGPEPVDNEQPQDIEVEVEAAPEDQQQSEPEKAEDKAPEPTRKKRDNRWNNMTRTVKEATAAREEAERVANEAIRRAQMAEAARAQDQQATLAHWERGVKYGIAAAKQAIIDAKAAGDFKAETDAQAELSGLMVEERNIRALKAQMPQPNQQRQQQQPQRQQQRVQLTEETQSWINDNDDWVNPRSPNFDREMAAEANQFATRLERQYRAQGRTDEIGKSQEYFQAIDDHMAAKFPEFFGEPEPPPQRRAAPPRMGTPKAPPAPVQRQAPVQNNGQKPPNRVTLTPDQRDIALAMNLRNPDGSRKSDAEHLQVYARNLVRDQANQRSR